MYVQNVERFDIEKNKTLISYLKMSFGFWKVWLNQSLLSVSLNKNKIMLEAQWSSYYLLINSIYFIEHAFSLIMLEIFNITIPTKHVK